MLYQIQFHAWHSGRGLTPNLYTLKRKHRQAKAVASNPTRTRGMDAFGL